MPDLAAEIKKRAKAYVNDNFNHPTPSDFLIIESAMMIGASIALESQVTELRKRV